MVFLNLFKLTGLSNLLSGKKPSSNVEGGLGLPQGFGSSGGINDLEATDFMTGSNGTSTNPTNLKNGKINQELGAYVVPNQQAYRWGFGSVNVAPESWGVIYVVLQSADATTRQGSLRLVWKDASRKSYEVMKQFRTNRLGGSATNRQQQVLLPELPTGPIKTGRDFAVENEFLSLDYNPDTDNIDISSTTSTIRISSTQYFQF